MNDALHDRLAELADTAIASLDVTVVFAEARRRRRRAAAAAALVCLAATGAVTAAVLSDAWQSRSLQPATPSPHRPLPPSEATLRTVLDRVMPGSRISDVHQFPAAYLPAGSSAFDRRNRLGRVIASVTTADGSGFSVAWDALDRPLDEAEAARFVGYTLVYDKQRRAPRQRLLRQKDGSLSGFRLYRIDDPLPGSQLVLDQWAANGANVVLRRRLTVGESEKAQQADAGVLLRVGAALVSDAPTGRAEPLQREVDAEAAAVRACQDKVTATTGLVSDPTKPWRVTSERGTGVTVKIWTRTPAAAARPTGEPDFVCSHGELARARNH